MRPLAPVEYPTSRHLDTPSHKNSLAVSEKTSSRNCLENPNGLHLGVPEVGKTRGEAPSLPLCAAKNTCYRPVQLFSKQFLEEFFSEIELPPNHILGNPYAACHIMTCLLALGSLQIVRYTNICAEAFWHQRSSATLCQEGNKRGGKFMIRPSYLAAISIVALLLLLVPAAVDLRDAWG